MLEGPRQADEPLAAHLASRARSRTPRASPAPRRSASSRGSPTPVAGRCRVPFTLAGRRQDQRRVERKPLVEQAVAGEMDEARTGSQRLHLILGGLRPQVRDRRPRIQRGHGLDLDAAGGEGSRRRARAGTDEFDAVASDVARPRRPARRSGSPKATRTGPWRARHPRARLLQLGVDRHRRGHVQGLELRQVSRVGERRPRPARRRAGRAAGPSGTSSRRRLERIAGRAGPRRSSKSRRPCSTQRRRRSRPRPRPLAMRPRNVSMRRRSASSPTGMVKTRNAPAAVVPSAWPAARTAASASSPRSRRAAACRDRAPAAHPRGRAARAAGASPDVAKPGAARPRSGARRLRSSSSWARSLSTSSPSVTASTAARRLCTWS